MLTEEVDHKHRDGEHQRTNHDQIPGWYLTSTIGGAQDLHTQGKRHFLNIVYVDQWADERASIPVESKNHYRK